jgi:hypothetical protein
MFGWVTLPYLLLIRRGTVIKEEGLYYIQYIVEKHLALHPCKVGTHSRTDAKSRYTLAV